MKPYALAITSCDRHDLLKQTLSSFIACADQQPRETFILEDSAKEAPEWLKGMPLGKITWINNGARMGQVYSIDRLWAELKYDYIFWCEDDWQFTQSGFIEASATILEHHPNIYTVCLRTDQGHPHIKDPRGFEVLEPYWRSTWGGCTWNPGLRRLSDHTVHIGSVGKFAAYGEHGLGHEARLSKHLLDCGYRIAALPRFCHHIGGGRSRAVEPLEVAPKVLIAVPACHNFSYGKWESEQSPHYNRANEAYGTDIHISGPNPRIAAVRDTWFRDVARFPNVTAKFFFGKPPIDPEIPGPRGVWHGLPDEEYLPVADDYAHLPQKTIAICRWALEHDFQYMLKVDDDTAVYVNRALMELQQNRPDYGGREHCGTCTGGPGYWLSARAMSKVQPNPDHWAEDVWIAKCMGNAGIRPMNLPGHYAGGSSHWFDTTKIPANAVTLHALQPETLRKWHSQNAN